MEMTTVGATMVASVLNPGMEGLFVSDPIGDGVVRLWRALAGTQFAELDSVVTPPDPDAGFPYGFTVSPD